MSHADYPRMRSMLTIGWMRHQQAKPLDRSHHFHQKQKGATVLLKDAAGRLRIAPLLERVLRL